MNLQVIEKQQLDEEGRLYVHSIFPTIQGEGPFSGRRAIFVRLAGCNLQCPLCDTDYTPKEKKDPETAQNLTTSISVMSSINYQSNLIVLTGGEPFRQNIRPLVHRLLQLGFEVQVETNGTLWVDLWSGLEDWFLGNLTIVCSPKTGKLNEDLFQHVDALKYVLHADWIDSEDGLPLIALGHSAFPKVFRPPKGWENFGMIFVHPVDDGAFDPGQGLVSRIHYKAAYDSAMKFGYTLGLQMHKFFRIP